MFTNPTTTTMKSNFKLAPLSCHCKLNVLVQHLKQISAQKSTGVKGSNIYRDNSFPNELLFQRYI